MSGRDSARGSWRGSGRGSGRGSDGASARGDGSRTTRGASSAPRSDTGGVGAPSPASTRGRRGGRPRRGRAASSEAPDGLPLLGGPLSGGPLSGAPLPDEPLAGEPPSAGGVATRRGARVDGVRAAGAGAAGAAGASRYGLSSPPASGDGAALARLRRIGGLRSVIRKLQVGQWAPIRSGRERGAAPRIMACEAGPDVRCPEGHGCAKSARNCGSLRTGCGEPSHLPKQQWMPSGTSGDRDCLASPVVWGYR